MTGAQGGHTLDLDNDVRSVAKARSFVRRRCAEAGLSTALCDTAALLASETVTNAFVHGHSAAVLTVRLDRRGVLVEVRDANPLEPRMGRLDDYEALGGRGMAIVAEMSTDWGSRRVRGGKIVWFRLDAS
ncbi:MAG: ATP-binding protein [Sporichthyaceae bacterium]|jgi:anti-sigma regulatory factor (Ser/Thr protein kinase)